VDENSRLILKISKWKSNSQEVERKMREAVSCPGGPHSDLNGALNIIRKAAKRFRR